MSININQPVPNGEIPNGSLQSGLPDLAAIEQLANELFKMAPGVPTSVSQLSEVVSQNLSPDPKDHPKMMKAFDLVQQAVPSILNKSEGFNVNNPPTGFHDPHLAGFSHSAPSFGTNPLEYGYANSGIPSIPSGFPSTITPPSASGAGVSPAGAQSFDQNAVAGYGEAYNGSLLPSGFSLDSNAGSGIVPHSVAGSGASPSGIHHGNEVDLNNPQTSLVDPHAGTGKVPSSLAGSGISPSLLDKGALTSFGSTSGSEVQAVPAHANAFAPNPSNYLPESDLINIIADISSFGNVPQLPFSVPGKSDASFYFLNGSQPAEYASDFLPKTFSPFSGRDISVGNERNQTANAPGSHIPFDVNLIKKDFPILQEHVNGRPLIWLDNAATTQKPKQVIDRVSYFYEHENSNIHRAAHELAARATDAYEGAREKVRGFINARSVNEVVFVRGTTEAINLVAKTWGDQNLNAGDEIIVSHLEHHANIVPWKQLADKKGLKLRVIPVDDDGQILLDEYAKLLNPKTRLVSFTQVSNALGTVTPAKQIIEMAHSAGAKVLLDGAQSVSHLRTDVTALNCDWFVFSGHKVFGPTGIGALYGKEDLLNETQPWQGGGNMIVDVTFEHIQYHNAPSRFEAGTGNIADAVGLGAAIDYVNRIGIDLIHQYEHYLLVYATRLMQQVPGLRLIGTAREKASVLSFVFEGYKTEEVGAALNQEGIAVRSGHHCAQPILRRFGLETTVRPSLAFYNTCSDVDVLVETLYRLRNSKRR